MNNIDKIFPEFRDQFIQNMEVEVKSKQEEEVKEKMLPFDVIKDALANLNPNKLSPSELISRALTELSNDDPTILKALPSKENNPALHEGILNLVTIYKQIKSATTLLNANEREPRLETICKDLLVVGDVDKAIEIAETLVDTTKKGKALLHISKALIAAGNVDKGLEVARRLPKDFSQEYVQLEIIEALTNIGESDKLVEYIKTYKGPESEKEMVQNAAFGKIALASIKKHDIDTTLAIVNKISVIENRSFVMESISKALTAIGNVNAAIQVANQIPIPNQYTTDLKGSALINICKTALARGDIDTASGIVDAIVKKIPVASMREETLIDIAKVLIALGKVDVVIATIKQMPVASDLALESKKSLVDAICHALIAIDNIDKAIEVAKTITDANWQDDVLGLMCYTLLDFEVNTRNVGKAIEIANTMTDPNHKAHVLAEITRMLNNSLTGG